MIAAAQPGRPGGPGDRGDATGHCSLMPVTVMPDWVIVTVTVRRRARALNLKLIGWL